MHLIRIAASLHPEDHLWESLGLGSIDDHLTSQVKPWSNLLGLVTEHVTELPLVTLLIPVVVVLPVIVVPVPIPIVFLVVILIPPAASSLLVFLLRVGLAEDILPHISLLIFILILGPVIPVVAPAMMTIVAAASASVLGNKLVKSESSKCASTVLEKARENKFTCINGWVLQEVLDEAFKHKPSSIISGESSHQEVVKFDSELEHGSVVGWVSGC